jgi:hypothetical protein
VHEDMAAHHRAPPSSTSRAAARAAATNGPPRRWPPRCAVATPASNWTRQGRSAGSPPSMIPAC